MRISLAALAVGALAMAFTPAMAEAPTTKAENGILTNSFGKALYTRDEDKPGEPGCGTGCRGWAPFRPGPDDAASGDWSIVNLADGSRQWAYKAMPVYTHNADVPGRAPVGQAQPGWRQIPGS